METKLNFDTINGAAAQIGVPACRIRAWVKQGRVPGFFSGSRFYVNLPLLRTALERGDFATATPEEREEA